MRKLLLPLVVALGLVALTGSRADALVFGIEGGLYTPTSSAKDLIGQEYQFGLRFILPPWTPFGVLNMPGLNLDLGFAMPVGQVKKLDSKTAGDSFFNFTPVYRYSIPISSETLFYLGVGGRITTLWGDLGKQLADGSVWGHLRGSMNVVGGTTFSICSGAGLIDVRLAYGVLGFTSWEATVGTLINF